jgi:hypothetical protein
MTITYTSIFHSKVLQKFTQIGNFGFKTNHLATLLQGHNGQSQGPSTQTQTLREMATMELTDRNPAWQHLLRSEEVASRESSGSMLDVYNIGSVKKRNVASGMTFKIPFLVGAVESVDLTIGMDPK